MKTSAKKVKQNPGLASSALVAELNQHQKGLLPYTGRYLGKTNLDIGCGNGITSVIHQRELGVAPTLCDVGDIRDLSARSFPFFLIQEGRFPFPDQSFDSAYLQYVIHHLPTEKQVEDLLAEAHRVARRVVIVEEIAGARTDIARAKEFDKEVNERIHPGASMPVYKYYTVEEIQQLLQRLNQRLLFHAIFATGSPDNGFLETHIFCAE